MGSQREVTKEQMTQNGASVTHSPVRMGAVRTEREMSALNSAHSSRMSECTRKAGKKDVTKDRGIPSRS